MDDIGPASTDIEVYIQKQLKSAQLPEYIADELLKKWDASKLSIPAKHIVARFCLLNGFFLSLLRILKLDLRSGKPLPWSMVLELFYQGLKNTKEGISKELSDALLTGATRDQQLHTLAAIALRHREEDPRWKKIIDSENKDHLEAIRGERERLFKEVQIFKSERMDEEVIQILNRILSLFPNDPEAQSLIEKLKDQELEVKIHNLKEQYQNKTTPNLMDVGDHWEDLGNELGVNWGVNLEKAIKKIQKNLSVEETYLLSVALFQMNLFSPALKTLRFIKDQWKIREKLWEIDLLLSTKAYAEALSASQIILNQNRSLNDVVKTALYYSARAFHGLGDDEQAVSILRGIAEHDPHFRDASILIIEWNQ